MSAQLIWHDMREMLRVLPGFAQEERDGTLKVTRNGRSVFLREPVRRDSINFAAMIDPRSVLEHDGAAAAYAPGTGARLLVVIDHRFARIYKAEFHRSKPQRLIPYDRSGAGRHLHHMYDVASSPPRLDSAGFHAAIAKTLQDACEIVLFGRGTGAGSAMERLFAALEAGHPAVADRVIGCVTVQEEHLAEDQLLAQAKRFYEDRRR
jgi:hypothetical protein